MLYEINLIKIYCVISIGIKKGALGGKFKIYDDSLSVKTVICSDCTQIHLNSHLEGF